MSEKILDIKDERLSFFTPAGEVKALNGVSFTMNQGDVLGVVGESGSGKSVSSLAIMGLIDYPGRVMAEKLEFNGQDLQRISEKERRNLVGAEVAMIFQDPMASLNPCYTVGFQIMEAIKVHQGGNKSTRRQRAIDLLNQVGIPDPASRLDVYPHQLSGGMSQRVMIAMAIACRPKLLIADKPTTALDVTIQAQILDLLRNLKDKINSSIMFITHDLGVIAEMADYVVVMYAGRIVEQGTVEEIFAHPAHPYTVGLMASKPVVGKQVDKLYSIPGKVPNPINMPNYCYFKDRCEMCLERCNGEYPCEISISPTHRVSCYRYYDGKRPDLEDQVEKVLNGTDNEKEGE